MVRAIDIQDQLTKTPLIEKVQQGEKAAEEGQLRYQHLNMDQVAQKQLKRPPALNQDEQITDSYERKQQGSQQQTKERPKTPASHAEPDLDEQEMTHLGFEIDTYA
ncbi:MAG: hypothetical protein D6814_11855 [Calditrichaeota bacterium]|nr:MAG: hypothetical protein D6814_11855 [Calditrichota bacterium]